MEQKKFSTGRLCYFTIDDNLVSLSSGYQALLRIFTEIYYVQNTEFNRTIFIIDELDIHLDAMMCQRIVEKLKECFPNIKIVATVYSINFFQENLEDDILMLKEYESNEIILDKVYNDKQLSDLDKEFIINEIDLSEEDKSIKEIILKYIWQGGINGQFNIVEISDL